MALATRSLPEWPRTRCHFSSVRLVWTKRACSGLELAALMFINHRLLPNRAPCATGLPVLWRVILPFEKVEVKPLSSSLPMEMRLVESSGTNSTQGGQHPSAVHAWSRASRGGRPYYRLAHVCSCRTSLQAWLCRCCWF